MADALRSPNEPTSLSGTPTAEKIVLRNDKGEIDRVLEIDLQLGEEEREALIAEGVRNGFAFAMSCIQAALSDFTEDLRAARDPGRFIARTADLLQVLYEWADGVVEVQRVDGKRRLKASRGSCE